MPNWAEGTIKVRGTKENIVSFLKNELQGHPIPVFTKREDGPPDIKYEHNPIEITEDDERGDFTFSCQGGFYLKGTRRAFIETQKIEYDPYSEDGEIETFEISGFQQAWGAIAEKYTRMSKEHQVDIKIFTFELGMEFTQEIEIIDGEVTKDIERSYKDYSWEVPFSNLGG